MAVVITGSGTGIGRATAIALSGQGKAVVLCGRRPGPLNDVARLIRERGGDSLALQADVRDAKQMDEVIRRTRSQFGRIDALVNNAGIGLRKPLAEMSESEWDETLDTNLKGVFICCKAVVPAMLETGEGVIVNVSSVLGKRGIECMAAYCASKFGVVGLTEALADELKHTAIRVYAVCPDSTVTDLHVQLVGAPAAMLGMPPEQVAGKIASLVTGRELPATGTSFVVRKAAPAGRRFLAWAGPMAHCLRTPWRFLRRKGADGR